MADQKEIISTINNLIETLKDGQKGFKEAADAVSDPQLNSLFTEIRELMRLPPYMIMPPAAPTANPFAKALYHF